MSTEIRGNSYIYIVDESYGINKNGLIDIGTESIVYKGLKTKIGGGLQFSCVLKFKPKKVVIDGKIVDRVEIFKNEELKIFQELRECRSVVRIDDVVDDLGDFSLKCEHISSGVIDSSEFFCVVEEFIDGWNLYDYCLEEFWKLRKVVNLAGGMSRKVDFSSYSEEEKHSILTNYNYNAQLKFQNQILMFMINLCEIMEFVTEHKNILHLDIKPENIMVTRHGKELVLIDFGRSRHVTRADRFIYSDAEPVNYDEHETQAKQYQYGTLGYAAPECFCEATANSKYPFNFTGKKQRMSIESDIFSFGATFWECLNLFELITGTGNKDFDIYDFYRDNLLREEAYCNRDLSFTSPTYHLKLEKILKKCTRSRKGDYENSGRYYHSYAALRKDLEQAMDSTPTVEKDENVKVRTAAKFASGICAVALVLMLINGIYHSRAFNLAHNKWNNITTNYNDTQFAKLDSISRDYMEAAPATQIASTYNEIAKFTYGNNGSISDYEASLLVDLIENAKDSVSVAECIDEIMIHADTTCFRTISSEIVRLGEGYDSDGYKLAKAIYNVEVSKTSIVEAYETLKEYRYHPQLSNAVAKLKYVLDNDDYVAEIMEATGETRQEILAFLDSIDE